MSVNESNRNYCSFVSKVDSFAPDEIRAVVRVDNRLTLEMLMCRDIPCGTDRYQEDNQERSAPNHRAEDSSFNCKCTAGPKENRDLACCKADGATLYYYCAIFGNIILIERYTEIVRDTFQLGGRECCIPDFPRLISIVQQSVINHKCFRLEEKCARINHGFGVLIDSFEHV